MKSGRFQASFFRAGAHALPILTVAIFSACDPAIRDLDLKQNTIQHLPTDVALQFLQGIDDNYYLRRAKVCKFTPNGIVRLDPAARRLMPGSLSYELASVSTSYGGYIDIAHRDANYFTLDLWCSIDAEANARESGHGRLTYVRKIITALLSLGVHVRDPK